MDIDDQTDNSYIFYNNLAVFIHFASAISMIFLLQNKDPLVIPYTETYTQWNQIVNETCPIGSRELETSNGDFCIEAVTSPVDCDSENNCYGLNLGWLVISFHLLSFGFQLLATLSNYTGPIFGYQYSVMVKKNKNPLRFIEYSFSASIMLISIALLNGVTDINLINSISILTSACQLCGLVVEFIKEKKIKWLLHVVGWLQFCWAYGIIGHAFLRSLEASKDNSNPGPPNFVYLIVILLFLLYSSFGFVQLFELIFNINPILKEKIYVMLSLSAKLFLGWMIFSNVLLLS
tara:strand:- start:916 stop:1788 length:873 start_codon:yes stop_codon:yes gene_type:complete